MDPRLNPAVEASARELPLSLPQREVWLDQQAWPGSTHLNIGGGAYLEGELDLPAFQRALQRLVDTHEALRLVPLPNGRQRLLSAWAARLHLVDLPESMQWRETMAAWWDAAIRRPFQWDGQTPPWRFTLLRAGEGNLGLTIQFHHVIMDGWGTTQVMQQWAMLYTRELCDKEDETPSLPVSGEYLLFVEESLAYQRSRAFIQDASFWQKLIPDLPPPLFDRRYPSGNVDQLPAAHLVKRAVSRGLHEQVSQTADQIGATPFAVYLATLAVYLGQACEKNRVIVGVPSINRGNRRERLTPGMFVGVFLIEVDVSGERTFAEVVASVGQALRAGYRARRYPLSELGRERQLIQHGRDGLFDVLLSFERQDYDVRFGSSRLVNSRQLFSGVARYPLGVTVCEFHREDDVELILEASEVVFDPHEAIFLADRLVHLLEQGVSGPSVTVDTLDPLPPEEREHLLSWVHRNVVDHPDPLSFITQFETWAARQPETPALVWDGGDMSYGRLNCLSGELAAVLRMDGLDRGRIAAVLIERSPEFVIAILAIAKTGGAFLILDPDNPPERLRGILDEIEPVTILHTGTLENLLEAGVRPRDLTGWRNRVDAPSTLPYTGPSAGDLAYVLYTSGSTGRPKGVRVSHGALARRLEWIAGAFAVGRSDRSGLGTQSTFDPALIELCLPLVSGGSVAVPPAGKLHPKELAAFAHRHQVTFMAFVPTTLRHYLDGAEIRPEGRLRVACCGGEVLSAELAERFRKVTGGQLFNVYGPTEATIFATAWSCDQSRRTAAMPIGRPLDDTRIYILGPKDRLRGVGQVGEIAIGGGAVALGYVRDGDGVSPFAADPFLENGQLYRTGDRGWLSADGIVYFIGRTDRQVKFNGYRIELGEIESVLLQQGGVKQAAVRVAHQNGRPVLHAWVAATPLQDAEGLMAALRTRLPDYMRPGGMTILPVLPQTATGKIDYVALPEITSARPATGGRLPSSQTERDLVTLWEGVLRKQPIGVSDNFFALGGDSFAALEVLVGIERRFGRRIPLLQLSENPTVAALARLLGQSVEASHVLIPLSRVGTPAHLYLAASGQGDLMRFTNFAEALDGVMDVTMIQPPEWRGGVRMTMLRLAELYAQQIDSQRHERIFLAGFSVGGVAALEVAHQLRRAGKKVDGLILIDSVYPSRWIGSAAFWRLSGWLVRNLHLGDLTMNGRRLAAMFADPGLMLQVGALQGFSVEPPACDCLLVKSSGLAAWDRLAFRQWRSRLPGLGERQIPGLHGSMFDRNNVQALADAVAEWTQTGLAGASQQE